MSKLCKCSSAQYDHKKTSSYYHDKSYNFLVIEL